MKIKLVAFHLDLFFAWKKHFGQTDQVDIIDGNILDYQADAIVSPANSFGYMDGGLDLKYSQYFGWELEAKVRQRLESEYCGEIPVGNAIIVATDKPSIPFLISAPTMRVPSNVSNTVNAYLAFKAILQMVRSHNRNNDQKINSILCPGLGTGEGKMPANLCALQMFNAHDTVVNGNILKTGGLAGAVNNHLTLLGNG